MEDKPASDQGIDSEALEEVLIPNLILGHGRTHTAVFRSSNAASATAG